MNKDYYINTFNCEALSDKIFFAAYDINLVFKYLIERDDIILLSPPDEDMFAAVLYGNIVAFEDYIYLIPFHAKNIWKLCNKNRWEKITDSRLEQGKFMGAVSMDNNIYLFGFCNIEIYKFNILTYKITKLKIDIQVEMLEINKVGFLGADYEIVNGKIFVPVMCANKILEIDPEIDLINTIDVPGRSDGYSGIAYDGNGFWLAPRKGRYFAYYLLNGKIEEYKLPKEYEEGKMYFGGAYREKKYIIFTAFNGKNFRFNPENPREYEVFGPSIYYCKILNSKGKVIHEKNGRTYYVKPNGSKKEINLSIPNIDRLKYIGRYTDNKMIFTEKKGLSIDEYLKMVKYSLF